MAESLADRRMTGHRAIDSGLLDPATWSTTPFSDGDDGETGIVSDEAVVAAMTTVEATLVAVLDIAVLEVGGREVGELEVGELEVGAPKSRSPGSVGDPAGPAAPTEMFVEGFTLPGARDIAAAARGGGNPVIPLLAALRPEVRPGARDLFHLGATSQDILDTALMVIARDAISQICAAVGDVTRPLAHLADLHRTTAVAGRTLGQHAAPTTFGLRLSVLLDGIVGSFRRLRAVALPAQLGGSVGTLAVLVDLLGVEATEQTRRSFAARLGLTARIGVWHVERTPVGELGAALAGFIGALGRLGLEIAHLSSTEIGELDLVAAEGEGGSSAMPQKRNPVAAVLLVGNARRAPALAGTLLGSQLALDDRPAGDWHAEWQPLRELLRLAIESTALAADAIAGVRVNASRMRANIGLSNGAIHAERAQWALVPHVGRARAAQLVRTALDGAEFVPALLAAVEVEDGIDRPAVADRIREVTTPGRQVGLSESLIDAAIAAAAGI